MTYIEKLLLAIIIAVLLAVLYLVISNGISCNDSGHHYVRGLWGMECI